MPSSVSVRGYDDLVGPSSGEFQNLSDQLDTLSGDVAGLTTDVGGLYATSTVQGNRITGVEGDNVVQATQIGTLSAQVATLSSQNATQDGNIAAATTKNAEQDGRLDNDEINITNNTSRISSLEVTTTNLGRIDLAATATNGQILTWSTASSKYVPQAASAGATALSALTDVQLAALGNGQVLTWNAGTSKWENQAAAGGGATALSALTDCTITSVADLQALVYSSGSSTWVNAAIPRALSSLTGVTITSPATGQLLTYNGTAWVNQTLALATTGLTNWAATAPSANQVPVWVSGTSKWTPGTLATTSLSNWAATGPTNGQFAVYSTATSKWTPTTYAPSSTIAGASDYVASNLANADVITWNSSTSKWNNTGRLTTLETAFSRLASPTGSVTLSTGQTACITYGTNVLPTESATAMSTVSDGACPFAVINRSSDYILVPTAVTSTRGYNNPTDGANLWKADTAQFQYVGAQGTYARFNADLGQSTVLALNSVMSVSAATGNQFNYVYLYGTNSAVAMTETADLTNTSNTTYTLICYFLGGGSGSANAQNTGPFRYICCCTSQGQLSNGNLHVTVRAAAGGVSGQSILNSQISLARAASGYPIVTLTNPSQTSVPFDIDCGRLGQWLLWRDLLTTIVSKQTLRLGDPATGSWMCYAANNDTARELQFWNDVSGFASGFVIRASNQASGKRLIIRPNSTNAVCLSINLNAVNATDDVFTVFKNTASGSGDVLMSLLQNGNLFTAGTMTPNTFLGQLNPWG